MGPAGWALLGAGLLLASYAPGLASRALWGHAARLARAGRWDEVRRLARLGERVERVLPIWVVEEYFVASWAGEDEAAVAGAALRAAEPELPLRRRNAAVNAFITAGRYGQALALRVPGPPEPLGDRWLWILLELNLAEAEYNLGAWAGALETVDRLLALKHPVPQLIEPGLLQQRAWILAHLGDAAGARDAWARVQPRSLGPLYQAEYAFTGAAVCLAEGQLDRALERVEQGVAHAIRVPSQRNGRFLRARVHAARGATAEALADFEAGAAMPYRGQGGEGLLAWGDLLRSLGRSEEAAAAWRLAVERDPESESARLAAARLLPAG